MKDRWLGLGCDVARLGLKLLAVGVANCLARVQDQELTPEDESPDETALDHMTIHPARVNVDTLL